MGFEEETWHALNLLSRESMKMFQELADEAFRDLLQNFGRPTDVKAALQESGDARVYATGPSGLRSQLGKQ